jgi:GNAT superfamily N-acetyltransferase
MSRSGVAPPKPAGYSSAEVHSFVSEPLADPHQLEQFSSGKDALDIWLQRHARHAQSMRTARTFVWHTGDQVVVAYFSLAAHLVVRADLPPKLGRGAPDAIPAVLLARLALDRSLHGQGLGGELLLDALSRAVQASEVAAARLVVVDAIDEAAVAFYQHHGFTAVPGNRQRLVQKISDIVAALGR